MVTSQEAWPNAHCPCSASGSHLMSQCLRPCMIHGARSKESQTKRWLQTVRCVWVGSVSFRRCSTSKQGFVNACKSGACVPHWCAAGIGERANPECFVIVLSSNPISISGHSINPIKTWLKVITQLACPRGASPGHSGPAAGCLQAAPRLFLGGGGSSQRCRQGSPHSASPWRWRCRGCAFIPLPSFHSPCAFNG